MVAWSYRLEEVHVHRPESGHTFRAVVQVDQGGKLEVIRYSHSTSVAIFCLFNTKSLNKCVKCISWRDQGEWKIIPVFDGILGQVVSFPYLRKPSNSTDLAWGRVEPT